jgi:RNA polymerase sigma-70 factor (ECF subfamily)
MDSDESLFERLIGGDLRAFDLLYARFERPLSGFVRAYTNDPSEVEDLVHEAFMTVLRRRHGEERVQSFRPWLFTVARNLCLKRARERERAGRAAAALRALPVAKPSNAEEQLHESERVARLEHAVSRLPAELAEVYRLRGSGLSYQQVADVLAVPLGTVKWRAHEMIQQLREEIER